MGKRVGKHGMNTWSVPGGYLEYGENFAECAAREVYEETGIKIKNIRFVTVTNNIFPDEQKHSITIWMEGDWESGKPSTIEADKFISPSWFTYETMPIELFIPVTELKKHRPETFKKP